MSIDHALRYAHRARIKELEKELTKEQEVVDFYANLNNWLLTTNNAVFAQKGNIKILDLSEEKTETMYEKRIDYGGKRARARQKERNNGKTN